MLYVRPALDSEREFPVSVTLGEDGTTTLTEQLSPLPKEHYRVEKFLIADPADIDNDCIDDITELGDPVGMNPLNPARAVPFHDGVVPFQTVRHSRRFPTRAETFPITAISRTWSLSSSTLSACLPTTWASIS